MEWPKGVGVGQGSPAENPGSSLFFTIHLLPNLGNDKAFINQKIINNWIGHEGVLGDEHGRSCNIPDILIDGVFVTEN